MHLLDEEITGLPVRLRGSEAHWNPALATHCLRLDQPLEPGVQRRGGLFPSATARPQRV